MGIRSLRTASISTGTKRSKVWDQSAVVVTNSFESIATVSVGAGGSSTITFSSIPSTYTHLQIRGIGRDSSSHNAYLFMRFNTDTNANYTRRVLGGNGGSVYSSGAIDVSIIGAPYSLPSTANFFGASVIDILDYKNTSKYKTVRGITGWDNNGGSNYGNVELFSGLWRNTNAITSIELSCESTFAQYSQFALYGIKGA